MRLRLHVTTWPHRALVLTDTPRPICRACAGFGEIPHDYADEDGEYAGTDYEPCPCWNPRRRAVLLRLPRRRFPRRNESYVDPWADNPPF
ncbi:conserved hypothetical protein [Streptomyces sp. SPB78]|uniref:hypothetical protein n=1 Tax=Streptomyces sp. (strain SPB78) TaxID=591157 RepID=UPI0001B54978|nr:hypothetical protein [Streptomyces sp. SPB78]EFL01980.1 conserved hypothetical protein [Streptomyces sp. SPB78]